MDMALLRSMAPVPADQVKLVYSVIPRKDLRKVVDIIHQINPRAFYSVEDIRSSESGVFPRAPKHQLAAYWAEKPSRF